MGGWRVGVGCREEVGAVGCCEVVLGAGQRML